MWAAEMNSSFKPNIFGYFRYFLKFSPFNCQIKIFRILTLIIFLSMCFRIYWLFYQIDAAFLTIKWAERNLSAFITFESFSCIIAMYLMTKKGSIDNLEKNIGAMQSLRIKKNHEALDNYKKIHTQLSIFTIIILASLIVSTGFSVYHNISTNSSFDLNKNWFLIFDAVVSICCAYVNLIFLPIHVLLNGAIRREFDVFNHELNELSQSNQLGNVEIFQKLSKRHLVLTNFTNFMLNRLAVFMQFAPFTSLLSVLNSSYLLARLPTSNELPFFISTLFVVISTIFIASLLLYPVAFIQISMLKTSEILMSDATIPTSTNPMIYSTYRLMVDRSLYNRTQLNVIYIFSVNKKNIERAFYAISNVVLVMVFIASLSDKF